jgi:hypothetical protein
VDPLTEFVLRLLDLDAVAAAAGEAARTAAAAEIQRQLISGRVVTAATGAPATAPRASPVASAPARPASPPERAPSPRRPTPAAPKPTRPAPSAHPRAVPAPDTLGAKRTRDQLTQTADAVLEEIRKEPGIIPEAIAKKLGLRSRDITLPLAQLRGETGDKPRVKWSGVKRFTRYTAK